MQIVERARVAIAVIFFVNGAVLGGWAAIIASVEARLGVGHGAFGMALLALAAGAIVAMPIAGGLIARQGSRRVALVSGVGDVGLVLLPAYASGLVSFSVGLLLFGMANGAMDVAMNAHGVAVERRLGRPIMSSLHGIFSIGALVGSGLAIPALEVVGAPTYTALLSAVLIVVLFVAGRHLLAGDLDETAGEAPLTLPRGPAVGLGLLAFLALMSEGAMIDWSAIYLKTEWAASPSLAAAGFAAFAGTMAAGRLAGDWLRLRFGTVLLVRGSAIVSVAGLAGALAAPNIELVFLGLALAGLGIGNVIPALFGAAGRLPGQAPGLSIATCTTLGYAGFLIGPPLIGRIAEASSLGAGLALLVAAMALVAVAARATRHADAG